MMFSLGSSLEAQDFKRIIHQKSSVALGLVLQMILLPSIALGIAYFAPISLEWKIGILIVALCPGGATSNYISYILKADTALSVSLTTVNSFLIIFSVPLLFNFGISALTNQVSDYNIQLGGSIKEVLFFVLTPMLIGLGFRKVFTKTAIASQNLLKWGSTILLGLVFLLKFLRGTNGKSNLAIVDILELLPYCLLLHFSGMLLSYFLSQKLLKNQLQSITIAIEVGLQNTALALLIANSLFADSLVEQPALAFAMFSFFTTLGFGWVKAP